MLYVGVHFISDYDFTRFRCAENRMAQDHFRCVRTRTPQKSRPDLGYHVLKYAATILCTDRAKSGDTTYIHQLTSIQDRQHGRRPIALTQGSTRDQVPLLNSLVPMHFKFIGCSGLLQLVT